MTWPELSARMDAGTRTVIVPTGGTEQNGRHMILAKHNIIVAETARRLAVALGDAVVAPVMAYVPQGDPAARRGHMGFPGTLSLRPATFAAVLRDTAESLRTHGFTNIVLLGDSGANQSVQAEVASELSARWASDGVRVIHAGRYYAANNGDAYLASRGFTGEQIGTHAGIRDTSELMAITSSGIRPAQLGINRLADGANGDSSMASADLGRRLLELKVAAALEDIRHAGTRPGSTGHAPAPAPATGWLGWLARLLPF
jgi:creatinine amidohydrolase/Fe(II)-dependent formamide hydrolase-like protein